MIPALNEFLILENTHEIKLSRKLSISMTAQRQNSILTPLFYSSLNGLPLDEMAAIWQTTI